MEEHRGKQRAAEEEADSAGKSDEVCEEDIVARRNDRHKV
jgi:hypothetical protein